MKTIWTISALLMLNSHITAFIPRYVCLDNDVLRKNVKYRHQSFVQFLTPKNDDQNKNNDENFEPIISPFDIRKEEESSRKLFRRLSIFDTLRKAGNVVLYFFVGLGFLLNIFGYAFLPTGEFWRIKIGTIQERQFQMEINRNIKELKVKDQQQKQQE